MPSNQTPNYRLSQWERTDRVLMEDFNADNAKIDGALKAEADARAAGDSAINAAMQTALGKKGNCQIYLASATNIDTSDSLVTAHISLPGRPLALLGFTSNSCFFTALPGVGFAAHITPGSSGLSFSANWNSSGTSVTFQRGEGSQIVLKCKLILAFYAKS